MADLGRTGGSNAGIGYSRSGSTLGRVEKSIANAGYFAEE